MAQNIEEEYVHQVYSRLATYQQRDKPSSPRIWPKVKHFVEQLGKGSVLVDVGCGETKYHLPNGLLIGIDPCADVLMKVKRKDGVDLVLGDALRIPVRSNSSDACLLVSVLHHFSTLSRRKAALEEVARVLRPRGRVLIYVWAFEQPNGQFPSQDLLVPWNMHETPLNGRLPQVKFHKDSTKEQRVIESSIPISIPSDSSPCPSPSWFSSLINRFKFLSPPKPSPPQWPPSIPRFLPKSKISLLLGINKWSPSLGSRLSSLLNSVEDQFGNEMAEDIMNEAVTEALASIRKVTFYRFYHVFKRGEMEDLIDSSDSLKVVSSQFEHGNWCVVAEKLPQLEHRVN